MQFSFDQRQQGDGLELLRSLKDRSAALVFFDPQWRQLMDKLAFGNEGDRQSARAQLPQMNDAIISDFVIEIERVLKSSGYLAFWMDKFALVSNAWARWIPEPTTLCSVDLIAWDKQRIGMGKRTRSHMEYLVILQRGPRRAGATWTDHSFGDGHQEKVSREHHPHAKPRALIERLILATTRKNDLVVDPCAGSFVVLEACQASSRRFIGCDLILPGGHHGTAHIGGNKAGHSAAIKNGKLRGDRRGARA